MDQIELNDLSRWSAWPARLLNLTEWQTPDRTIEKTLIEYDRDKYKRCLEHYAAAPAGAKPTPDDMEVVELGDLDRDMVCSDKDELLLMTFREMLERYRQVMFETMEESIAGARTVVELGSGWGIQLWRLRERMAGKKYLGGECATNAVKLAGELFAEYSDIEVREFNFYDTSYDAVLGPDVEGPIVIFTSFAIHQLPSAKHAYKSLMRYGDRISRVFHFEPIYSLFDGSLLDLMRRRYVEVNDYNRDMREILEEHDEVEVLRVEPNIISGNPLHPASILEWKFR